MRSAGFQPAEPLIIWTVTDGRRGIENQALGLAEAIARRSPARVFNKRVQLRTPWSWLHPRLVFGARQALSIGSDQIAAPWPDLWIGCGRSSIPLSMGVRQWSAGRAFVVQLQDPRINPREFDVVVPPVHDELEGPNVLPIVGSCHRVTPERVDQALIDFQTPLEDLPGPRIAVLIGGKSKRQDINAKRAREIADALVAVQKQTGGSLMCTLTRRTSEAARLQLQTWLAPHCALFHTDDGEGPNPYFAMLGAADHVFVTEDSVNLATEAAATGKPVHVLAVDGTGGKIERFQHSLAQRGCARKFNGVFDTWTYPPLLETDRIAAAVLTAWAARARAS